MRKPSLLLFTILFVSLSSYGAVDSKDDASTQQGTRCGMQEMRSNMQQMRRMMGSMQGMHDPAQRQQMMQNQMGMMMDNMEVMMSMMGAMQSGKKAGSVECPRGGGMGMGMMPMHKGMQ